MRRPAFALVSRDESRRTPRRHSPCASARRRARRVGLSARVERQESPCRPWPRTSSSSAVSCAKRASPSSKTESSPSSTSSEKGTDVRHGRQRRARQGHARPPGSASRVHRRRAGARRVLARRGPDSARRLRAYLQGGRKHAMDEDRPAAEEVDDERAAPPAAAAEAIRRCDAVRAPEHRRRAGRGRGARESGADADERRRSKRPRANRRCAPPRSPTKRSTRRRTRCTRTSRPPRSSRTRRSPTRIRVRENVPRRTDTGTVLTRQSDAGVVDEAWDEEEERETRTTAVSTRSRGTTRRAIARRRSSRPRAKRRSNRGQTTRADAPARRSGARGGPRPRGAGHRVRDERRPPGLHDQRPGRAGAARAGAARGPGDHRRRGRGRGRGRGGRDDRGGRGPGGGERGGRGPSRRSWRARTARGQPRRRRRSPAHQRQRAGRISKSTPIREVVKEGRRSSSRSRRTDRHQGRALHEPRLAARPLRRLPADGRSRRHLASASAATRSARACARRSSA